MESLYDERYTNLRQWTFKLNLKAALYNCAIKNLKPCPCDSILEIGCDQGVFIRHLKPLCKRAVGIDLNAKAIEKCTDQEAFCMDAASMEFEDKEFDKIISMHTIEHIPNLKNALSEMSRVLKNMGIIVLIYPYELIRGLTAIPSAVFVHKNPMMARKMHIHKLNHEKISSLIHGTGLSMLKSELILTPMPVYVSILKKELW